MGTSHSNQFLGRVPRYIYNLNSNTRVNSVDTFGYDNRDARVQVSRRGRPYSVERSNDFTFTWGSPSPFRTNSVLQTSMNQRYIRRSFMEQVATDFTRVRHRFYQISSHAITRSLRDLVRRVIRVYGVRWFLSNTLVSRGHVTFFRNRSPLGRVYAGMSFRLSDRVGCDVFQDEAGGHGRQVSVAVRGVVSVKGRFLLMCAIYGRSAKV